MKKWTAVLLAALFVLTAAGCSGDDTPLPGVYNTDGETVKPTAPPVLPGADLYDSCAGTWTAEDGSFIDIRLEDGAVCVQFGNWGTQQVVTGKAVGPGTPQHTYVLAFEENGETVQRTYTMEKRSRTQIAFGETQLSPEAPAAELKEYTYDAARQRTAE